MKYSVLWEQNMTTPTWGIVLTGQRRDFEDCIFVLPARADPWVEMVGLDLVLRTSAFDGLEPVQAYQYADQLGSEPNKSVEGRIG